MLQRFRSAITGRFTRRSVAAQHPDVTLGERVRTGRELRVQALMAAADGVLDSQRSGGTDPTAIAVGAVELGRLRGTLDALR